jgi:hypothetical protein
MPELAKYEMSDAWLLLAVIYASRHHPASLGEILMLGDYINHTGFTQEELDGGFYRLKVGDWINRSGAFFSVSEKTSTLYQSISRKELSARDELGALEAALGLKNAS